MQMVNITLGFGREKTVAVIDASEGGAGVAIMTCPSSGASTILAEARSALTLEHRAPDHSGGLIGQQIREAGEQALKLYRAAGRSAPISSVYAVVHAPWVGTKAIHAGETFDTEVHITDALISKYARAALAADTTIDRRQLLEASVTQVRLNGYATAEPAGKYAHEIEVVSIASECDAGVRGAVQQAAQQLFPVASIVWRSGLRALMTLARESAVKHDFVAIDMGPEATHVASIYEGATEQKTIEEGVRSILARVAGTSSPEELLSNMRMLSRDACADDACEAIQKAMAVAEPELVRVFGEAFAQIAASHRLANELFLMTHTDIEPWMSRFFARIDFGQFTVTSLPFSVLPPSALDIDTWVAGAQHADSLTVGAALVNIECRS